MALINATSFVGFLILLYLSSFVVFAILRIATGISIQRLGLSSLRHVSYTPKDGLRIDIRGLGLAIHRPTFASPTWVSLRLQELCVTVDPALLQGSKEKEDHSHKEYEKDTNEETDARGHKRSPSKSKSDLWRKLTKVKEHLKQIHRKIDWLRLLDIYATDTTLDVVGAGSLSIGSVTLACHTRRKLLDRGRLFRHKKDPIGEQRPAEWIFTVRSILLGVYGREPIEMLDNLSVNVHGLLYRDKEGLRDTSIAVKLGRLHVPVDEILEFRSRASRKIRPKTKPTPSFDSSDISFDDVVDELERPGSREAAIVQTVADSKEFLGSVLRGVQEIQLSISFIRISKEMVPLRQANLPVVMNLVTHEIGIDLHRLEQNTPAHRMYFSRHDVAHQALVAAVSISMSLDEDDTKTSRILYVPMATTTVRTTLPSKTMSFTEQRDAEERNTNVFFSNLVITSPAIDLSPQHLIQLLALTQRPNHKSGQQQHNQHRLISRLLPRSSIKLSIHEPVVRFVLPITDDNHVVRDDYNMIISAISSVSLDVESSHSAHEDLLYSLSSTFRVVSHRLYYQSASNEKHNLLKMDSLELEAQVSASTEVFVIASGSLRSFSGFMVREEVSQGVYNVVKHFAKGAESKYIERPKKHHESFVRRLPPWLLEFHFEGSQCSLETAGVDHGVSKQTRGVALELESWTTDYVAHRQEHEHHRSTSRRKVSTSIRTDPHSDGVHLAPPISPPRHQHHSASQGPTDGRRLTTHVRGVQGFIIESLDEWEQKPFMSIPRIEVALSTSRDHQGQVCHLNSHIRAIYFDFSLYRAYSIGIAGTVIQDAFAGPPNVRRPSTPPSSSSPTMPSQPAVGEASPTGELTAFDFKAGYIQVKASMPHDPPVMLQIYDTAAGRHRWSAPFLRSHLARLHAESPHVRAAWARLVSISNIRVDLRHSRKKTSTGYVEEKSIDLATDFIRMACPHGLRMYKVFDNFVNTNKAMMQLMHRFKTRTNDYILKKPPDSPKHVPRISIRCRAFCFELEDDAFEWRLNNIYHAGRQEQKQRIAREDAFKLKVRRMQDDRGRRDSSWRRGQSARPPSRDRSPASVRRSRSQDSATPKRRSHSHSRGRRHNTSKLRYDRDGMCALSSEAKVQTDEAWNKLLEYNARSWKSRINWLRKMQSSTVKNIRRMFSGADEPPQDVDDHETVLGIPNRPGLLTIVISDLHLVVDKPSFPLNQLPDFLHDVGKGMPRDMRYSLLIPMHLSIDMGEARFMLRDYPLNLLHVPAIRPGQPPRLPSWSLRTDFVIAEEFRGEDSIRHIQVDVVPKGQHVSDGTEIPGFAIDVRRTVGAVKTYSKPIIDINTSAPTTITWGNSYQPTIQDAMMVIESFTKPEIDPSDRVGFWDKIRLSFHSRPIINWKGDGEVHLRLKGSRDPYVVTGFGAGFVMCWRNNVRWAIHEHDDPKLFMTVRSGEYVLAIPDYSHHASNAITSESNPNESDSLSSSSSQRNATIFSKVIMKVSGNVQWTAGLVFERDKSNGERTSHSVPHYDVVQRNPKFLSEQDLVGYDAFKGFRSQHIHLSVAVSAPHDKDWTSPHVTPSESYNSVHLSPRFFSHFFAWWSLFHGVMSLPIRQGPLWRGPEKTSKKFGRHLATIKYALRLSPLFIAHVYKHKDSEDYESDLVSATGLKFRLDSFILDLHQRREWFNTLSKGKMEQIKTSAMKMYRAELDFINADLRALSASIAGTTAEDLKRATSDVLVTYQSGAQNIDMSKFTIPDHDFSWIDMDDFMELDWILPAEANPETQILPLAFMPRFTYFRQTDHGDGISGDKSRESPFGNEDTHQCMMPSRYNDPKKIQMHIIEQRLEDLEKQIKTHERMSGEFELKVVRDGGKEANLEQERKTLEMERQQLQSKKEFLQAGLKRLATRNVPGDVSNMLGEHVFQGHQDGEHEPRQSTEHSSGGPSTTSLPSGNVNGEHTHHQHHNHHHQGSETTPHDDFASDFNNLFLVHNAQVKWNNSLRNIILRYSHQVSQRRGFVYYMSRRAVKFIIDIVEEQAKKKAAHRQQRNGSLNVPPTPTVTSPTDERDEDTVIEDRIRQLLADGNNFVSANDPAEDPDAKDGRASTVDAGDDEKLAEDFLAMNSYHIRLVAPQIQLQSEKNVPSIILLTAKGMQFKVVSIMDKERLSDDVSGLVQRRFALDMDGVQIFVTNLKLMSKYIHLYSGNRYGNPPGSAWPPWAAIETMFDFQLDPFGFQRVVQKTSASLRYEKYNALRLKYNEEVAQSSSSEDVRNRKQESRIDHLWVDFPRLRAMCDSQQYYTMYIIVLDLLLYSEPLEKTRSERLEKIMLASDFSDLRGAPEIAESLQGRIRQLEELKLHFTLNARLLDKQGWQDRIELERDLASCEEELFFIMKAINTSQQRNDERSSESSGFLRWYLSASQIVWHLMRDKSQPLLEVQLSNATYERIDNSDGSNHNAVEIEQIRGWNLLPNALYPEIIGIYSDPQQKAVETAPKMLQLHWFMLEAIAGIPVLEEFQVTLHPLKVQLERSLSKALFEYIFPGVGSNAFDSGGFSPLMVKNMKPLEEKNDEENEKARQIVSPDLPVTLPGQDEMRSSSPGAMGRRLQPTYNLKKPEKPPHTHHKTKGLGITSSHHNSFFGHSNRSKEEQHHNNHTVRRQSSSRSLRSLRSKGRVDSSNSLASVSKQTGTPRSHSKERRGLTLRRHNSSTDTKEKEKDKKAKPSDDVSQMMARASNYMTLAHVKLNSFVICLSYKGQRDRNLEDLHDFVFRMPTLEYRNKTWSNLDLALHLKKDAIRALISHAGAIIGNKFSHHRVGKKQQERLREIAAGNTLIPNSDTLVNTPSESDANSLYTTSDATPPRMSFQSDGTKERKLEPSPLLRTGSWSSMSDPRKRSVMSVNAVSGQNTHLDTSQSTISNGSHDTKSPVHSSDGNPFSPVSPSRIDPLGPIQSILPRPTTSGSSGFIPTRSLLKDVVGRHFSGSEGGGLIRPTIHKGRVRFTSGHSPSNNDNDKDQHKDKDKDKDKEKLQPGTPERRNSSTMRPRSTRSDSAPSLSPGTDADGEKGMSSGDERGDEHEAEHVKKRKSVLQKVFGQLRDKQG